MVSRDAVEAMVFEIENTNIMNDEYYKQLVKNIELEGANRDAILETINAKGEDVEASNRRMAALKSDKEKDGGAGSPGPTKDQMGAKLSELDQFYIAQHNASMIAQGLEIEMQEAHYLALAEAKGASEEEILALEEIFAEKRKQIKDKEREQDLEDIGEAATKTLQVAGNIFGQMASIKQKDIEMTKKRLKEEGKSEEEIAKITKKASDDLQQTRFRQAQFAAFEAAINAYNSVVGTPIVGPVLGPIAGATALAFGLKQAGQIKAAQFGMDEVVNKPTMILAGEAGAEQVSITPLEGPNTEGPQGGQSISVSIQGNVMTEQFVEEELSEKISEAIRRGVDFGIS